MDMAIDEACEGEVAAHILSRHIGGDIRLDCSDPAIAETEVDPVAAPGDMNIG
jgi:hypothetical protein